MTQSGQDTVLIRTAPQPLKYKFAESVWNTRDPVALEKTGDWCEHHLKQNWIPFIQGCFVPSLV